jgi:hypothetical protein
MTKSFEKHFKEHRALYEKAVRKHVCEHCVDFGADQACHKTGGVERCAVTRTLKEIVCIASAVHANKMTPYIQVLREKVCSHCANSKANGRCETREAIECCLDRYLPLVLDAVEDVQNRLRPTA